jgi:hypothetical protein
MVSAAIFLHAWPHLDPFEMRHAVRKFLGFGAEDDSPQEITHPYRPD